MTKNMQDAKSSVLHRLKISRGHLNKIIKMVEEGAYCVDVVHQSLAVQSALKKIDQIVLSNHLRSCVVDSIKKGDVEKVVEEIDSILDKK